MSLVEEAVASKTQWQGSWSKLGSCDRTFHQTFPVTGWMAGAVYAIEGDGEENVVIAGAPSSGFTTWEPQPTDLPFRADAAGVATLGAAWVCGGTEPQDVCHNDVYASVDGLKWTQKTAAAAWAPRQGHSMALFQERLWVLAGWNPNARQYFTDVWRSADAETWQQQTTTGFNQRFGASAVVFKGQLWLIGGTHPSAQISCTANGADWHDYPAPWTWRMYMRTHVIGNTLYALGGNTGGGDAFTDVYSTTDGQSWTHLSDGGSWKNGNNCGSFVAPGGIVVFGGLTESGDFTSDIYCYTPPA